jgi:hypothetical protein
MGCRGVEPDSNLLTEISHKAKEKANSRVASLPAIFAQDDVTGRRMLGLAPFEVLPRETVGGAKVIEEANRILAAIASDTHRFGAPRLDYVEDEVGLLKDGDWHAAFLLYLQD